MYQNIAVLIDAENFSHNFVTEAFAELNKLGKVRKACAYGDFGRDNLRSYKEMVLRHNITPVQNFTQISGKNSADIALSIDAMDMLYTGIYDAFAIFSNDSDFIRLVVRLKEGGLDVIGVGTRARNSHIFDEFILINNLKKQEQKLLPAVIEPSKSEASFLKKLKGFFGFDTSLEESSKKDIIAEVIASVKSLYKPDELGFYNCSLFGNILKEQYTNESLENLGYPKKLGDMFKRLESEGRVEFKFVDGVMKFKPKD